MFGPKLGHQQQTLYSMGSKRRKMTIICEILLVRHIRNDIAQVISTSSQLMHPLLIDLAYDLKIEIKVCYECLTDSNHPTLHLL